MVAAVFLLTMLALVFRRNSYTRRENLRVDIAIAGGIALLFGFMFINVEGSRILHVMKSQPLWGSYVILLAALGIGIAAKMFYDLRLENREVVDLTTTNDTPSTSVKIDRWLCIAGGAWIAGVVMAVVWLAGIARRVPHS